MTNSAREFKGGSSNLATSQDQHEKTYDKDSLSKTTILVNDHCDLDIFPVITKNCWSGSSQHGVNTVNNSQL
jgi:hypothetical protein